MMEADGSALARYWVRPVRPRSASKTPRFALRSHVMNALPPSIAQRSIDPCL
jgi:hypothetical protein